MRIDLKRLNWTTKRLSGGRFVTYVYAWRGGPMIWCAEGTRVRRDILNSPEFLERYQQAMATLRPPPGEPTLARILESYENSSKFTQQLAPRSQREYTAKLRLIANKWGDLPLSALTDPAIKSDLHDWREELAQKSLRQADYTIQVMSAALSWALRYGKVEANPLLGFERLYAGTRIESVWPVEAEQKFLAANPPHMCFAEFMGVWTGQRQGDLLELTWFNYDGRYLRLMPNKTKRRERRRGTPVVIPVMEPLKAALDGRRRAYEAVPTIHNTILVTSEGRKWTQNGFQSSWRKAMKRAGIEGLTFNDLRGTAVTRLAMAGCSVPEICAITGHSHPEVTTILDAHYLYRDPVLAENAMGKLAAWYARLGQSDYWSQAAVVE